MREDIGFQLADALESDWRSVARDNQLSPRGDWLIWLILAGRGWGKTRTGAEWVKEQVESRRAGRIALVGATAADARDVMVEGESGIMAISPKWARPDYEPSKRRLTWPNGAIATCFSAEEGERLRGPQHDAAWCDELGAWRDPQAVWDNLQLGLRLGKQPRVVVTTTPKPTALIRALVKRDGKDVVVTRGPTRENQDNLASGFMAGVEARYGGTRLGRQELEGELLEDVEGALWKRDDIDKLRIAPDSLPHMRRVVVAIDPAVSNHEGSDETGIVVCGLGEDGHGYVLADGSGRYAPVDWARKAVALYRSWLADRIVAETNQGGAMVEATLRMVDASIPYRGVHASRGKIVRAEPVSALYEQRRVHHAGAFQMLEDQLCSFSAGSMGSPDRLDALVWALTDLMVTSGNTGMIEYLANEVTRLALPPPSTEVQRTVRMRAPVGFCGTIMTVTGRSIPAPANGVITLDRAEADAMRFAAGWVEILGEEQRDG